MAGKAGSQILDTEQQYQYSMPFVTPSGHEISFYDTPENQRLIVAHASGSSIEFKTDGSVFIKSIKDLHLHGSVASDPGTDGGNTSGGADTTTQRFDTDVNLEVAGTLRIKAKKLEVDIGETTKVISGTDMILTANNIEEKANENIALKGTKSVYVDTKEYRERSVSHRTEEGTMEDSGSGGGLNYMNVKGNFVINNTDPNGSISLISAGYLNLVCGQERIDVVGQYTTKPSSLGVGTFTQIVKMPTPPAPQNKSKLGDFIFSSTGGAAYTYSLTNPGSMINPKAGLQQTVTLGDMLQNVMVGNRTRNVMAGKEDITIALDQTVIAKKIYLN